MQIDPKDHHRRQQKPSRSFQTFSVENDAKQHGGGVWRSGEIDIRGRRKRGVKQAAERTEMQTAIAEAPLLSR